MISDSVFSAHVLISSIVKAKGVHESLSMHLKLFRELPSLHFDERVIRHSDRSTGLASASEYLQKL